MVEEDRHHNWVRTRTAATAKWTQHKERFHCDPSSTHTHTHTEACDNGCKAAAEKCPEKSAETADVNPYLEVDASQDERSRQGSECGSQLKTLRQ